MSVTLKSLFPCPANGSQGALRRLGALVCGLLLSLAGNALAATAVDLGISGYTWTPDPVVRGGDSTFTVDVTNFDYTNSANGLTLTVKLPSNVDFSASTPPSGCSFDLAGTPKTLVCSRASLAAQDVWSTIFTGKGLSPGVQSTEASIVAADNTDSNPDNDTSVKNATVISGANLGVGKTGPASAVSGDVVSFTINVGNAGPDAAGSFRVTDTLPSTVDFTYQGFSGAGWSCALSGVTLSCDHSGPLANGASAAPLIVTGRIITGAGSVTNSAAVVSTDSGVGDPVAANNGPAQATVSVSAGTNLRANKSMVSAATGQTTFAVGDTVTITLSATNEGPLAASGVTLSDTVPSGFTGLAPSNPAATANCSVVGQLLSCNVGNLANGVTSAAYTFSATAPAAVSSGTNTATVARATPTAGANTAATVNYGVVDPYAWLTLTKSKAPTPIKAGEDITNTIVVKNESTSTSVATGTIRVTDALSPHETYVSHAGAGWSCSGVAVGASGTLTCDYAGANLVRGATLTPLIITTKAETGYLGTITNTACTGGSAGSPHVPPSPAGASGECQGRSVTGSNRNVDLQIVKTADAATLAAGSVGFSYTLEVQNNGVDTAPTVTVSDLINAYYNGAAGSSGVTPTIVGGARSGESCVFNGGTKTVECTLKDLAPGVGNKRAITIALARPLKGGVINNTASVATPDAIDSDFSNNSSSVSVTVDPVADIAVLAINGSPDPVKVGVNLVFTTEIKNNGPSTAAGVVLRQRLEQSGVSPDRMLFVSAGIAGTSAACSYVTFTGAPYAGDKGIECTGFSLADNESRQLIFTVIPAYYEPGGYPDPLTASCAPAAAGSNCADYTSLANITTTTAESNAGNNTGTETVKVTTKAIDLSVVNDDPGFDPVAFEEHIVYTVTARNNGPSQATGFKLTVTPQPPSGGPPYTMVYNAGSGTVLPAGATCSQIGADIVCYLGADQAHSVLAANASQIFKLRFDTGPSSANPAGSITYKTTAKVESYETGPFPHAGDTLPGNNSVQEPTTVLPKTDLKAISKTVSKSPVSLNEPFTYTVVVANLGPSIAPGVRVSDVLPTGLSVDGTVTASLGSGSLSAFNVCSSSGTPASGVTVSCNLGPLPVASGDGDTPNLVTITIPVKAARGTYTATHGFNSNRSNVATLEPLTVGGVPLSRDPVPGNNTSPPVNVQIQKSSIAGSVYSDHNQNDALDAGEKIAAAVAFKLTGTDAWGNALNIDVNSSGGDFLFDELPTAGAAGYTIVEIQPSGYYDRYEVLGGWSGAPPADTGVKPADTCDGVVNCASAAAANTVGAIKLPTNVAATGYLFQEYRQASVSGHVYKDLNNDGNRSGAGETDIVGIQLKIAGTTYWGADLCAFLGSACTQTTTGAGYAFTVPPGSSYVVSEQTLPAGHFDGKEQNGSGLGNVLAGSDNRNAPENITVGAVKPNDALSERNFGELPHASIAGSVFVDSNSNAQKEGGETGGVPGVTLALSGTDYLGRDVCTVLATCTFVSDAGGNYLISGLPPGTYSITETPPAGMTHTGAQAGSAGGTGGAGAGATSITAINLGAGVAATGYNFGEFGQAIAGRVYIDLNRNGQSDAGEPGIAGVQMTLSGTTTGGVDVCSVIAPSPCSVLTAADGSYSFSALPASNGVGYTVTEQAQSNAPLNNYQDGAESVGLVNGSSRGSAAVNDRISGIVVNIGETGTGYNFGEWAGSLSGRVYFDADDNGGFNGGDTGLGGVQIALTGTSAAGAPVNLVATTLADGSFSFTGVPASNGSGYTITETQPADYAERSNTPGTAGGAPASAAGTSSFTGVVLGAAVDATGYLFGEKAGAISGFVYADRNNDGVKDAGEDGIGSVTLRLTGTTVSGEAVNLMATTNGVGAYSFAGLKNANAAGYTITETQPADYLDGKQAKGKIAGVACAACSIATANSIGAIPFVAGSAFTDFNFGEIQGVSVGGHVFHDVNNNGIFDAGEGLSGVTVTLSGIDDQGGVVNRTTTTDANGNYGFVNLRPSDATGYTLTETQPAGIGDFPTGGSKAGTVGGNSVGSRSDAAPNAITGIALQPGGAGVNYDFRDNAASIEGYVYRDDNDNGAMDGGEVGLAGITVSLSGAASATTITDGSGRFRFTGLIGGTYTLVETQPPGLLDGKETAGTAGGAVNNASYCSNAGCNTIGGIVVGAGQNHTGYLFGERGGSLSGYVYLDGNNDGQKGGGESGLAGVSVTLSGQTEGGVDVCVSRPSCTATTGADGAYLFEGVPPGIYKLAKSQNQVNELFVDGGTARYSDGKETAGVVGGTVENRYFGTQPGYNSIQTIVVTSAGITANGGNLGGYLFGVVPRVVAATLKPPIVNGYVYMDRNHTRVRDPGSTEGLPGWTAVLQASNGTTICTTTTNASGFYQFDNLHCPGYEVSGLPTSVSLGGATFSIHFSRDGNVLPNRTASGDNAGVVGSSTITSIVLKESDEIVEQNLPLDPAGVIYDAVTRAPVPGATIAIAGPAGFDPSTHLVGGAAATSQVTGADGLYSFVLQNAFPSGEYVLTVTGVPANYLPGTSVMLPPCANVLQVTNLGGAPALIQGNNAAPASAQTVHAPAACPATTAGFTNVPPFAAAQQTTQYYLRINITNGIPTEVLNNHIPLDPLLAGGAILVSKISPKVNVSKADLVPYTITATNISGGALANVQVQDALPPGFRYRTGSATYNGLPLEPAVSGRQLSWPSQTFAPAEKKTYKLILVVGAGVGEGEYVNQAWALNSLVQARISNIGSATVRVVPDPTFDCSDIIGKVFDDRNANGYQDQGEPGIPNVRVVTARGLLVTTDAEGRFHVACAAIPQADRGSNFVMKLDERTLPSGYRVTTENPRDVRVTRGKMVKLNFGATVHKVLRLEVDGRAFAAGETALAAPWTGRVAELLQQLRERPSVLRIAYRAADEGNELAAARLAELARRIKAGYAELSEKEKEEGRETPPLVIETESLGGNTKGDRK